MIISGLLLLLLILFVPCGTLGLHNLPPSGPVLRCMLCLAPCKIHLLQLSGHGSSPGCFWSTLTPFPSWGLSQYDLWDTILVHPEYMSQPSSSATFDFRHNRSALGLPVQYIVGVLLRPEDAADFPETFIVEGIDPLHNVHCHSPAFRAVLQHRVDIAVIQLDLCFEAVLL